MVIEQKIKRLLDLNEDIHRLVTLKFQSDATDDKSDKSFFAAFVIGKAYKTHEATMLLCQHGYGEDAFMLSRTLFELMVTISYVLQDITDDRLSRYMDYDWVSRKEMYDYFLSSDKSLSALNQEIVSRNEGGTIEKIQQEYERVMEKYKYRNGWSDMTIRDMSESIGVLTLYKTVYRTQCTIGHTNARSMNDYMEVNDQGEATINIGPNWDLTKSTLVVLFNCFLFITQQVNRQLSWGINDSLVEMENRFCDEVRAINTSDTTESES